MKTSTDPGLVKRLSGLASAASVFSVAIGLSGLSGWFFHFSRLTTWGFASVKMVANLSLIHISVGASCLGVTDNGEALCAGGWGNQAQRGLGILRDPAGDLSLFSVPVPNLSTTPEATNNSLSVTGVYTDLNGALHAFLEQVASDSR